MDAVLITPIPAPDESMVWELERLLEGLVYYRNSQPSPLNPSSPVIEGLVVFPGIRPSPTIGPHPFPGMLTLAVALAPALCTALGAWLGSRNGRKMRIKVGDIEAEAQTQEQVEKLLMRALEIQREIQERNQQPFLTTSTKALEVLFGLLAKWRKHFKRASTP